MAHLPPQDLQPQQFQKIFRGYEPTEVDAYINQVLDNYIALYNEYAQLETKLNQALERLKTVDTAEVQAKKNLENANAAAKKIISDAYERSDDILSSIRDNCDFILNSFKKKIDVQKDALAKIQKAVLQFKNGLFETYKQHIEFIEKISPVYELELNEETTPDNYVDFVIDKLKDDFSNDYKSYFETGEISLDPEKLLEETKSAYSKNESKKESSKTSKQKQGKVVDFTQPIPNSVIKPKKVKNVEDINISDYGEEENDIDSMMARAVQPEKQFNSTKPEKNKSTSDDIVTLINRYEDKDVLDAPNNDDIQLSFDTLANAEEEQE